MTTDHEYEALLEAERIIARAFDEAHSSKVERETGIVTPQSARLMLYNAKLNVSNRVRDAFAGR